MMMKLQTQIEIHSQEPKIDYDSKILLLGSCFSENIGEKFNFYKFQVLQNPFGILFHPYGIEKYITAVVEQKTYTEENLIFHHEQWHAFDAHSRLSSPNQEEILKQLNKAVQQTAAFLKEATHIIITLGTSWIYQYQETKEYVANCHKIPQKNFQKQLIPSEEIAASIKNTVELIQQLNPSVRLIITVSPVRHAKDGFIENQRSKAHLISAVHNLLDNKFALSEPRRLGYFPSYEIMMDELRDYRFYAEDMLHPNKTAIDYIWQKFLETWIAPEALLTMQEVEKVQRGLQHRAFNEKSESHQKFVNNLQEKKEKLKQQFSHISF